MRKRRICLKVFVDISRFVAVTSRLDVNDNAIWSVTAVDDGVADATHRAIVTRSGKRVDCTARIDSHFVELDRDPEIDPDFANCLAEIGKGAFRIFTPVAHHNEVTAAKHHLVQSKVLEMAAIGEVYILVLIRGVSDRFGKQRSHRITGAWSAPRFGAWRSRVS